MQKYFFCFLFILVSLDIFGQVVVEGQVLNKGMNVLLSIYSEDTHQFVPVSEQGKFSCELPRYEECILIFYGLNIIPETISVNTQERCNSPIKLQINLKKGDIGAKGYLIAGPSKRIVTNGSSYSNSGFDFDTIEDKPAYASLIATISKDIKNFYEHRLIPKERFAINSNIPTEKIQKTEHQIGQAIYDALNKKKKLQQAVTILQKNYVPKSELTQQQCSLDLNLLQKEADLAKTDYELARLYLEKIQLSNRKKEIQNQLTTNRPVKEAQRKMEEKQGIYTIAAINLQNKQSDCKALRVQSKLELELRKPEVDSSKIKIRKAEISNIHLQQRMDNARRLTEHHNLLANDLTGRDRVVQLAYAQKHIAEQEELKLYESANNLTIWQQKNKGTNKWQRQITLAENAYDRQREVAWQAEMGYLEHIWHLQEKPEVGNLANDIYNRQNGLLVVPLLNKEKPEEPLTSNTVPTDNKSEVLSKISIKSSNDARGEVATVNLEEDAYEIVFNKRGHKQYYKNGKPITALTYRFETQRKFGEMIENIRQEDEKKSLWTFFKEKIQGQ